MAIRLPNSKNDFKDLGPYLVDSTLRNPQAIQNGWKRSQGKKKRRILAMGDSKIDGVGASAVQFRVLHRLKVKQQRRKWGLDFATKGSYGFLQWTLGTTTGSVNDVHPWCTRNGTWTGNDSGIGPGTRSQYADAGDANYITFTLDGTLPREYLSAVTSIRMRARRATDGGIAQIAISTGNTPPSTPGTGNFYNGTIDTNGASSYGRGWDLPALPTMAGVGTKYQISIFAPHTTGKLYLDGIECRCNDELEFISIENLANAGSKTDAYFTGSPLTLDNGQCVANMDNWSDVYAAIYQHLTNDQWNAGPVNSQAVWIDHVLQIADHFHATFPLATFMFQVPMIAGGTGSANRVALSQDWIPALYAATDSRSSWFCILDHWKAFGNLSRETSIDTWGYSNDSLHENDEGHEFEATDFDAAFELEYR